MAEIGRQAYEKTWLAPNPYQNFFVGLEPKIHRIIQKMLPPQKGPFSGGGGI
jgi:hypothetical protein